MNEIFKELTHLFGIVNILVVGYDNDSEDKDVGYMLSFQVY